MSNALCFNETCPSRPECYRSRPRPIGRRYTVNSYIVKEGKHKCDDGFIKMRPKDDNGGRTRADNKEQG